MDFVLRPWVQSCCESSAAWGFVKFQLKTDIHAEAITVVSNIYQVPNVFILIIYLFYFLLFFFAIKTELLY